MAYTITDVVNCSAAARQRREEALRGLDLPEEGAAQVALCLYGDEYNSPTSYDISVGGLPTLMVEGRGAGCSVIIDGETGFPVDDMPYNEWAQIFKEVSASSKN